MYEKRRRVHETPESICLSDVLFFFGSEQLRFRDYVFEIAKRFFRYTFSPKYGRTPH